MVGNSNNGSKNSGFHVSDVSDSKRRKHEKRGRNAEWLASIWLRLKGYKILQKRVRMRTGEIDLIATKGRVIAFIEVKARKTINIGLQSVPETSWRRISKTAEIWMAKKTKFKNHDWRYDLVVVCPWKIPSHLKAFWRP